MEASIGSTWSQYGLSLALRSGDVVEVDGRMRAGTTAAWSGGRRTDVACER